MKSVSTIELYSNIYSIVSEICYTILKISFLFCNCIFKIFFFYLYKSKIRIKIQNVKPNKPPVARKTLGPKCEEPFGGHPPTTADHVLLSPLYLSQWSKLQNLVKILFPRLIFQPLSWEPIHAHHNNIWNCICT